MSDLDIIVQIMFIALGMVFLSFILNKIFGLKRQDMKEIRNNGLNLQQRMKNAQIMGDPEMMRQLQIETSQLMKVMLKKQLIPMGVRCVIFLGIFSIIGLIYAPYEYWFITYFLFSLTFSLLSYGLGKLYKKLTGKEDKSKNFAKELMGLISPGSSELEGFDQYFKPDSLQTQYQPSLHQQPNNTVNQSSEKTDSWKDRIQQENISDENQSSEKTDSWKDRIQQEKQ